MALLGHVILGLLILQIVHRVQPQTLDQIINQAMPSSSDMDLNADGSTVRVELDMMFKRADWEEIQRLNANSRLKHRRHKRKAVRERRYRWTNNVIPYTLASNTFSSADQQQIQSAMNDWERYTCLDFRQATSSDRNKIYIHSGGGCSSYVGMVGGQQAVSLAQGCRQKGVIVHELGHAIGFHHEQTRPDRDSHVRILTQNIIRGTEYNFQRYSTSVQNDYDVPYDYTSVMHYGQYAFSSNNQPTIQTVDSSKQHLIGNRYGHSFRDIKLANLMYNCAGSCGSKTCPGEGFVGKDCQCYCPGSPVKKCDSTGTGGGGTGTGGGGTGGGGENECDDGHVNCGYWAAMGECSANPAYMLDNCKLSCDSCDGGGGGGGATCVDSNEYCSYWAGAGYCNAYTYKTYMETNCPKSCAFCGGSNDGAGTNNGYGYYGDSCVDENPQDCPYWAGIGECYSNPAYMVPNCAKSCQFC